MALEIIRPDEIKFANLSGCSTLVVNEVPVVGGWGCRLGRPSRGCGRGLSYCICPEKKHLHAHRPLQGTSTWARLIASCARLPKSLATKSARDAGPR